MKSNELEFLKSKSFKEEWKPSSFRRFLQEELIDRCRRNEAYSLRSFARSLDISPSSLSRLLNGQRVFSSEMIQRLGLKLGATPLEIQSFQKLNGKDELVGKFSSTKQKKFEDLSFDAFSVISDWYHYAILELTQVKGFVPDPQWIGKTLGLGAAQVNIAVERLVRLKLLKISKSGKWILLANNTNISGELKHAAYRNLQRQVLQQALAALDLVPLELRDQSSMTMSIDTDRLEEAVKKITEFRRELCSFLESGKKKDEVFQLSISLFPVTNLNLKMQKNATKNRNKNKS